MTDAHAPFPFAHGAGLADLPIAIKADARPLPGGAATRAALKERATGIEILWPEMEPRLIEGVTGLQ